MPIDEIDDFESDSTSYYTGLESGTSITSNQVYNGTQSLETTNNDYYLAYSLDGDGLNRYFSKGEVCELYIRSNYRGSYSGFVFGAEDDNGSLGNHYRLWITWDIYGATLRRYGSSTSTEWTDYWNDLDLNKWYKVKITWDDGTLGGTDGDITVEIIDTTDDTVIIDQTINDSGINGSGIGYTGNGFNAAGRSHWYDYVGVVTTSSPQTATADVGTVTLSGQDVTATTAQKTATADVATATLSGLDAQTVVGGSSISVETATVTLTANDLISEGPTHVLPAQYIDVTQSPYNADPTDGTAANDAAAIESAIDDAITAGHGNVYIPGHAEGEYYYIDDPGASTSADAITISSDSSTVGVSIYGDGPSSTVLKMSNGWSINHRGIVIRGSVNFSSPVQIFDIAVDGDRANQTSTNGIGIAVYSSSLQDDVLVENCTAKNWSNTGIQISRDGVARYCDGINCNSGFSTFDSGTIEYCWAEQNDLYGVNLSGDATARHCVMKDSGMKTGDSSTDVYHVEHVWVQSSDANGFQSTGATPFAEQYLSDVLVENCNSHGFRLVDGTDVYIRGNGIKAVNVATGGGTNQGAFIDSTNVVQEAGVESIVRVDGTNGNAAVTSGASGEADTLYWNDASTGHIQFSTFDFVTETNTTDVGSVDVPAREDVGENAFVAPQSATADVGVITLTAQDVSAPTELTVSVDVGTLTATGQDITALSVTSISVDVGTLTTTALDAQTQATVSALTDVGVSTLTGQDVTTLSVTPASADVGTLILSGENVSIEALTSVSVEVASLSTRGVRDGAVFYATQVESGSIVNPSTASRFVLQDGVYDGTFSVTSNIITVNESGNYHVSANVPIVSTTRRQQTVVQPYVNGSPVDNAVGAQSYVRNASGHEHASAHISTVLPNLSAGDTIAFYGYGVGGSGSHSIESGEKASFTLQKVDTDVFYADSSGRADGLNLHDTTEGELSWNTPVLNGSAYTLSDTETVTINEDGRYFISTIVPYEYGNVARANVCVTIKQNGTQLPSAVAKNGYVRNGSDWGTPNITGVWELSAGDTITVTTQDGGADGTVSEFANRRPSIFIRQENSDGFDIAGSTTTASTATDFNKTGEFIEFTTVESTSNLFKKSSDTEIVADTDGVFLAHVHIPYQNPSNVRTAPGVRIQKNGTYIAGTDLRSTYNRLAGVEGATNSGSIPIDVNIGDVLRFETYVAGSGDVVPTEYPAQVTFERLGKESTLSVTSGQVTATADTGVITSSVLDSTAIAGVSTASTTVAEASLTGIDALTISGAVTAQTAVGTSTLAAQDSSVSIGTVSAVQSVAETSLTGLDATTTAVYDATAQVGEITLSAQDVTPLPTIFVSVDTGAITATALDSTAIAGVSTASTAVAEASLFANDSLVTPGATTAQAGAGELTVAAQDSATNIGAVTALQSVAETSLTGLDSTVTAVYDATVQAGEITLSAQDVTPLPTVFVTAQTGEITLTPPDSAAIAGVVQAQVAEGVASLTSHDATTIAVVQVQTDTGTTTLSAQDPLIDIGALTATSDTGLLTVTSFDSTTTVGTSTATGEAGIITLNVQDPAAPAITTATVVEGVASLTSQDAGAIAIYDVPVEAAATNLSAQDVLTVRGERVAGTQVGVLNLSAIDPLAAGGAVPASADLAVISTSAIDPSALAVNSVLAQEGTLTLSAQETSTEAVYVALTQPALTSVSAQDPATILAPVSALMDEATASLLAFETTTFTGVNPTMDGATLSLSALDTGTLAVTPVGAEVGTLSLSAQDPATDTIAIAITQEGITTLSAQDAIVSPGQVSAITGTGLLSLSAQDPATDTIAIAITQEGILTLTGQDIDALSTISALTDSGALLITGQDNSAIPGVSTAIPLSGTLSLSAQESTAVPGATSTTAETGLFTLTPVSPTAVPGQISAITGTGLLSLSSQDPATDAITIAITEEGVLTFTGQDVGTTSGVVVTTDAGVLVSTAQDATTVSGPVSTLADIGTMFLSAQDIETTFGLVANAIAGQLSLTAQDTLSQAGSVAVIQDVADVQLTAQDPVAQSIVQTLMDAGVLTTTALGPTISTQVTVPAQVGSLSLSAQDVDTFITLRVDMDTGTVSLNVQDPALSSQAVALQDIGVLLSSVQEPTVSPGVTTLTTDVAETALSVQAIELVIGGVAQHYIYLVGSYVVERSILGSYVVNQPLSGSYKVEHDILGAWTLTSDVLSTYNITTNIKGIIYDRD